MQNLAHSASFESRDKDAPSNAETKHLACCCLGVSYGHEFEKRLREKESEQVTLRVPRVLEVFQIFPMTPWSNEGSCQP